MAAATEMEVGRPLTLQRSHVVLQRLQLRILLRVLGLQLGHLILGYIFCFLLCII